MGCFKLQRVEGKQMSFKEWTTVATIRKVVCTHANAEKYVVTDCLTPGKEYEVKNETDEFIFIVR